MEWLWIVLFGKGDDLFFSYRHAPQFDPLTHMEILKVAHRSFLFLLHASCLNCSTETANKLLLSNSLWYRLLDEVLNDAYRQRPRIEPLKCAGHRSTQDRAAD